MDALFKQDRIGDIGLHKSRFVRFNNINGILRMLWLVSCGLNPSD